jgi:hypothetical protein
MLQYLALNEFEMVAICDGESAEGRVFVVYFKVLQLGD